MEAQDTSYDFPEEILLEILVKLPFKSVSRFRCVSKSWLSLISDAAFFPCFVSRSLDSPPFALIFQCENYEGMHGLLSAGNIFKNFNPPYPYEQIPGLKVEATSDDLILYRSNGHKSLYLVANPLTGKCVKIPTNSMQRRNCGYTGLISSVKNGITSYNIVRPVKDQDNSLSGNNRCLNLEIFSSEEGEWRDLKLRNHVFEFDARPCIVFKGFLHWTCNKMTALFAYDPCSDQCRFISMPNEANYMNGKNMILGTSCENLYYFETNCISIQGRSLPGWRLWMLNDDKTGKWALDKERKERKIEAFGSLHNVLSTYSPLFPLAFHPWNKDIIYFWHEGYVLTFNTKKGWFEDNLSVFYSSWRMVSGWEIFPLLMPFCPTKVGHNRMTRY